MSVQHRIDRFHNAAFSANAETVAALLAAGADPNEATAPERHTPLHCAAMGNYIDEYLEYYDRRVTAGDYLKIIRMLAGAGADARRADAAGRTPALLAREKAEMLGREGELRVRRQMLRLARLLETLEKGR